MQTLFFVYTICMLLACVTAGALALAAYFVSRRKNMLWSMAFFLFYFLDLALIFQYEYSGQNMAFAMEAFYSVDHPILKTLFALGACQCIWLITCDICQEQRRLLLVAPGIVFVACSTAVLVGLDDSAFRQWLYYSLRQLFLCWCLIYLAVQYMRLKTSPQKLFLSRYKLSYLIAGIFVLLISIEDIMMILLWHPGQIAIDNLFPLYISERNFSENFLMLFFAGHVLRSAAETLRLRFHEPPSAEQSFTHQQIEALLPAYAERHHFTAREQEVAHLILLGYDNQNIASHLQLALGTVKAHVHHILHKTQTVDRQGFIQHFWQE